LQKKIYFASDLHLGAPDHERSRAREKHFVNWLRSIAGDVSELVLLGDIFDFWFEYKRAVPKGFVRLLGTLAELSDSGVSIHLFRGNHDLWYNDYLRDEIGAQIHHHPQERTWFGRKYFFAHGDGLGPGDKGYKRMKKIVTHPLSRWAFHRLHPNFGIGLAHWVSQKGGDHNYDNRKAREAWHHGQNDYLYRYVRRKIQSGSDADCFVFGHRHVMVQEELEKGKEIVILGDWIQYFSYLEISESGHRLEIYKPAHLDLAKR
jgi:UDP-2,3-diacylglucosamine hydrolase